VFQAEDGIRDFHVTGVQTCALPISSCGKRINPKTYNAKSINMIIQIPINTSRFRIPQCSTKSALDKNLNAIASSKNPKITLIVVIHPPDFGSEFNIFGKSANKANGKANARPKPVIPTVN